MTNAGPPLVVEIASEQQRVTVDRQRLEAAARAVLSGEGVASGTISIAVVSDAAIHELNRRYLAHDYPTDVLSFVLEQSAESLEGEVIVSADTALREAAQFGWSAADELLLYVVHGCLHLAGHDDQTEEARAAMQEKERHYLAALGVEPRFEEP